MKIFAQVFDAWIVESVGRIVGKYAFLVVAALLAVERSSPSPVRVA